ncbi:MAG TPA: ferrous iron transporter B, partial [Chloroflexi bacterium]|nr:ferrous iron transporter B [Chloroflexota bacterium]
MSNDSLSQLLNKAKHFRRDLGNKVHEDIVESIYDDAARIAKRAVDIDNKSISMGLDRAIDRVVTSRLYGFPLMMLLLTLVFWLTISGANVPSSMLATLFLDIIYPGLKSLSESLNISWWLDGLLIDGVYLAVGWVISVMLPPMAIFFPLFTLLEDLGYLP